MNQNCPPDNNPSPNNLPEYKNPKGFYRRGPRHPPHFDQPGRLQHVTFRLAGSLPAEYLAGIKRKLEAGAISAEEYRQSIDAQLHSGDGPDWLSRAQVADIVDNALNYFDGDRYDLHTWCIMPNHVHVLFQPRQGYRIADIVQSWKSFTSKKCNELLGRTGAFWQDDYFDRYMRNHADVQHTTAYILNNGGRTSVRSQLPRQSK